MERRSSFWNAETGFVKSILKLDPIFGTFFSLQNDHTNLSLAAYIQAPPIADTRVNEFWVTSLNVDLNPVELELTLQRQDTTKQIPYPLLERVMRLGSKA